VLTPAPLLKPTLRRAALATVLLVPLALACSDAAFSRADSKAEGASSAQAGNEALAGRMAARTVAPAAPASASDGFATVAAMDTAVALVAEAPPPAQGPGTTSASADFDTPSGIPAMLVRTGRASVEVDSLDAALGAIRAGVRRVGGYVAGTQMNRGEAQRREATIQLRVPSARFDEVVAGLAPLGKVEDLTVETADVGEEYADAAARIANARRMEQRLIDLLANRTGRLSDVLTVERELARVREDIERMEGRMRFLANRASLSTLTLAVHEQLPVLAQRPHSTRLGAAYRQAWDNFIDVIAAIVAMLGVIVPLGVVLAGIALAWKRWGRPLPRPVPPTTT
jgi:hypothetical protein